MYSCSCTDFMVKKSMSKHINKVILLTSKNIVHMHFDAKLYILNLNYTNDIAKNERNSSTIMKKVKNSMGKFTNFLEESEKNDTTIFRFKKFNQNMEKFMY